MKKKEVRWISRDSNGLYMQWTVKPQWRRTKEYTGKEYISHSASTKPYCGIVLKLGGLAKITILSKGNTNQCQ